MIPKKKYKIENDIVNTKKWQLLSQREVAALFYFIKYLMKLQQKLRNHEKKKEKQFCGSLLSSIVFFHSFNLSSSSRFGECEKSLFLWKIVSFFFSPLLVCVERFFSYPTCERCVLHRWNQFWQKRPIFGVVCNGAVNIVALSGGFSVRRRRELGSLILLFPHFCVGGKVFLLPNVTKGVCFVCWNWFWPKWPIFGWIPYCDNVITVT